MEKSKEMQELEENLLKIFGKNSKVIEKDPENIVYDRFSTGSLLLDRNLKGGIVKGSAVEISGKTGSGKTTLALHMAVEHQKKYPNEIITWLDLEKTYDPAYFKKVGIDFSRFLLVRPSVGEEVWESIKMIMKVNGNGMVVLDSIATLMNAKESEGSVGDAQMAGAARMNSQGWRMILPYIKFGGTTLIAINQVRQNIGGYGDPNVTTGGSAWEYYTRTRIRASVSKGVEQLYGKHKYALTKATFGNKDTVAETTIYYGEGINKYRELLDLCVEYGIIEKKGSWFSYQDSNLAQGSDSVVDVLKDNPELEEELTTLLLEYIKINSENEEDN